MIMLLKTIKRLLETLIKLEAKNISTKLNISDRVQRIAVTPLFVALKDRKDNIRSNPTCRLINPSKNELGKVSNWKTTLIILKN